MKYSSLSAISSRRKASSNSGLSERPSRRQHLVAHLADDLGARVEVLVHAMAEAHEAEMARSCPSPSRGTSGCCSTVPICSSIASTASFAPPCAGPHSAETPGGDGGVRIGAGAAREAHGRSARVLLVVRMEYEQQIERLRRDRIDLVGLARHGEEHVQQVAAVVEIVARIDERLAERVLVGRRGDRRNLGDDAVSEDLALPRVIDVHRVVIERGHRCDHRGHHRHRMGVVMKAVEEAQQRLVDHRVMTDAAGELLELFAARQLAVQQQVADLHERALLGELLDRIAAVQQHARHRRRCR